MNMFRLALSAAVLLAFSVTVFAEGEDDIAPRGQKGTITIITEPSNSDVYLDGEYLGKSPITKKSFQSGRGWLIIMEGEKQLYKERFNVWPNKENKIEIKTIMPHGTIIITTNPNKCKVYLDGENADRTEGGPLTLNSVEVGSHTVGADGCGKYLEVMVPVRGEQTTEVHLDVKSRKASAKIGDEVVTGKDK